MTSDEPMLREAMITQPHKLGATRTDAVAGAFRAVSRSAFIPEVSPEQAYEAENASVTTRDADGVALSSVSAARIQAFMLEQADIAEHACRAVLCVFGAHLYRPRVS